MDSHGASDTPKTESACREIDPVIWALVACWRTCAGHGSVAQLVEQGIHKPLVAGSSPAAATNSAPVLGLPEASDTVQGD